MQNKGFVKVFAVLLTLVCLFYLSFSFVTRHHMSKAAEHPQGENHYLDSVQNEKVFKMPLGMYRSYTPGVDTPVTLLWFAKTTYPELFEDIDMVQETKDYYMEVFGVELTDEQAASIFAPEANVGAGF